MSTRGNARGLLVLVAACLFLMCAPVLQIVFAQNVPAPVPSIKKVQVIAPVGLSGDPEDDISYLFKIVNLGSVPDSYQYTIKSKHTYWPVSVTSGNTGNLQPGEDSGEIKFTHHIWEWAAANTNCEVVITAWSQTDGFSINHVNNTLTWSNPVSNVSVIPPPDNPEKTAYPGDNITLLYTVTNKGNGDDVFMLSTSAQFTWKSGTQKEVLLARNKSVTVPVTVGIPSFNTAWDKNDFITNGTFYNTKGRVTLTATAKYMPVSASAYARVRILPYYQPGLYSPYDVMSVDPYDDFSEGTNSKALYPLHVHNMNNYPSDEGGTAKVTVIAIPPASRGGSLQWSVSLNPTSPYDVKSRDYKTMQVIVTEPPEQDSGEYKTRLIAAIEPQVGSVADPVRNLTYTLDLITRVGIKGGVQVEPLFPEIQTVVTTESVPVNYTVTNIGSGKDIFKLTPSTTNNWKTKILNASSLQDECYITLEKGASLTVTVYAYVPDNILINSFENITFKAVSVNDPRNGTGWANCTIKIITLYRVKADVLPGDATAGPGHPKIEVLGVGPAQEASVNYTVSNLGSSTETVRVTYIRDQNASSKWQVPSESVEWVMKAGTRQDESFEVQAPADPPWHDRCTVTIRAEIRDGTGAVVVSVEQNVTLEVRMLLVTHPRPADRINVYAMPGETRTYHLTGWNLGSKGPDNMTVRQTTALPMNWDAYFKVTGSSMEWRSYIASPMLAQYTDTFEFMFEIEIPDTAEEQNNFEITLSARNDADSRVHDEVTLNITLVVLDLAVKQFYISNEIPADSETVNITAEISAGFGSIGVSKDATHVEVVFLITSDTGYRVVITRDIAIILRGHTENVSISWTVPKLKWYERGMAYRISVNASTTDESPGANTYNNLASLDVDVQHRSSPPAIAAAGVLISLILVFMIFMFMRDLLRLRDMMKTLVFFGFCCLISVMFASVFLLPLGGAGLPILVILLVVMPGLAIFSYMKTRLIMVALLCGTVMPLLFGLIVGAGSGRLDYVGSVFAESATLGTTIPAAYSIYCIFAISIPISFAFLTRLLWNRANNAIMKVEMKIKDLKRTG